MLHISVDDGDPLDLKLADLFEKYHLPSIFYIPVKKPGSRVLSQKQIRELSKKFEIGGHTFNHVDLTKVSPEKAYIEIIEGKNALEDILGHAVNSFAFPYGHYNSHLVSMVEKAGFKNCRSGRIVNFHSFNSNEFLQHPNLQLYPHLFVTDLRHSLKYTDTFTIVKRLFHMKKGHLDLINIMLEMDEVHFWCHSQDIEKFGLWKLFQSLKSVGG